MTTWRATGTGSTLKLYRDCGPGNTQGTGFDAQVAIGVFTGSGRLLSTQHVAFPGSTPVRSTLNIPCLVVPPSICIEEAAYVTMIDLPPSADGYVLSYQRCCRSPVVMNAMSPEDQGLTCTVRIPPGPQGLNSSPRFNSLPPIALCVDQDMAFDHSASDPDGDWLEYALTSPLQGADPIGAQPLQPAPPPYAPIIWAPGYSESRPMDGSPGVAVDPGTGLLTVHPTMIGSYLVAVSVKDYRDGLVLSEVRRDFRFDVVACPAQVTAFFTVDPPSPQQQGTPIRITNASALNGAPLADTAWTVDGIPVPWSGRLIDWLDAEPGDHTVTLSLSTPDGCDDTYSIPYVIKPGEIRVPNVFSPNGDGRNDRFVIENVQYRPNHLQIFNRWGMPVYETSNYKNQWNGGDLPEGTYYFILEVDGRKITGHVTLLR
ncbi:MAG: gliding motility-associated C-terminal domain-containing protein [Flavobacteriales bacterium]